MPADWHARAQALIDHGLALVALEDNVVVAYVIGEIRSWEFGSDRAGWITALAVDPTFEGKGVARALMTQAADHFRAAGVTEVRTMIRRDNVPVLRFFRSTGFVAGPYTELELSLETP